MASIDGAVSGRRAGSVETFGIFAAIVVAITVARLLGQHFSVVDIDVDEAQYWDWSRQLALGYFSKPPLIAWLNAGSSLVCGDSLECVRAPVPLFYAGASLLIYAATRSLFGATTAFWAGVLLITAPGVAYSARIMSTDVPLIFFWAVALLAYVRLWRRGGWEWSLLLAVGIGFGLLAKYAMAYFAIGIAGAALVDRDARALLRNPRLWAGIGGGLLIFLPNVLWNLHNGLVTASATANYVAEGKPAGHVGAALNFLLAQFGVFGPVTFATILVSLVRFPTRAVSSVERALLFFVVPPVLLVLVAGLYSGNANANWAAVGVLAAPMVAAALLVREGWWRTLWTAVCLALIFQTGVLVTDAVADRLSFPRLGRFADLFRPTLGWHALSAKVADLVAANGAGSVAADDRDQVSTLTYYRHNDPQPVLIWSFNPSPTNQFELSQALTAAAPSPVLFVTQCSDPARLAMGYASVADLGTFQTPTGPTSARSYHAFLLADPKGPLSPLPRCPAGAKQK